MTRVPSFCCILAFMSLAALAHPAHAAFTSAEHPFILWTRDEAAAIRKRIETEPWAKARYEAMLQDKSESATFRNLFEYLVMGDQAAGEKEKKYLLTLIGNDPRKFKGDTGGGRHYDQYLSVLRYDILYDRLTDAQRKGLEDTFRDFITFHCEEETLQFTRTSWLPNMQWPRPMTAHLMAVALRDEGLIRKCFNSHGGWKYYFDDYLADGRFYGEEFGKQYSMIGEMFLWCRGVGRLGLNELGYGYVGKGGATMRRYVESVFEIGYPRVDLPGGMPHYPQITMGDARSSAFKSAPPYVFQKSIVTGFLPDGSGGNPHWIAANMNGRDHRNAKVEKMLAPHWFELAQAQWPDAHFDYFLAQMRPPGQALYIPSLFWGLSPIDPAKVTPPPAPSYIAPERGFVMLRAEHRPREYWEGPSPAVAFQLATYYVHYAHDAFSLLGFYAFNRPIYLNRQISNGYGGGCPWSDSARGHCDVMVDNLQWMLNDADPKKDHPHWPNPIGPVPTRTAFDDLVRFAAAHAVPLSGQVPLDDRQPLAQAILSLDLRKSDPQVYPGVDMTRALFLTREYLFDIFQLSSQTPRLYQWQIHTLGQAQLDDAWKPTHELDDRLYDLSNRQIAKRFEDPIERDRYELKDVHRLDPGGQSFSFTALQTCALPDVSQSILGKAWYDRKVGVRVWMLGEADTRAFAGKTPVSRTAPGRESNKGDHSTLPNEVGGVTLMVERKTPATLFAALHEPFENAQPRIDSFRRIQQTDQGLAVAVVGKPGTLINDRLLFHFWPNYDKPLTLAGDGESFTFTDRLYIRIRDNQVDASGGLLAMKLKVNGRPQLVLNGQRQSATIQDGYLIFGK